MAAPKAKTAAPVKGKVKMRKKEKKNVAVGNAYIKSTFNNTSSLLLTQQALSSLGLHLAKLVSRVHVSPLHSQPS